MENVVILAVASIVLGVPSAFIWLARTAWVSRGRLRALETRVALLEAGGPAAYVAPPPEEEIREVPASDAAREAPMPVEGGVETGEPADEKVVAETAGSRPFETRLASRWMVWAGAVAVAVGGVFLARHALAHGWFGPEARVATGVAFGLLLTVVGESLRRMGRRPLGAGAFASRRADAERSKNRPADAVPTALAGSGLFVAFTAVWAGYALYGMVPEPMAFAVLGVFSFAAFGLSLLHGISLAVLGLLGGFLTPALVVMDVPSISALFGWLTIISVTCVALARVSGWTLVAQAALAGNVCWGLVWMAGPLAASKVAVLGPWIVLLSIGFVHGLAGGIAAPSKSIRAVVWAATGAGTVLAFALAVMANFTTAALSILFVLSTWLLLVGRLGILGDGKTMWAKAWPIDMASRFLLPLAGACAVMATFLVWQAFIPRLNHEGFIGAALAFGALFGLIGFASLWGAAGPGTGRLFRISAPALWAGLSVAVPLALWCIGWAGIVGFGRNAGWTLSALGLAGASLAAASVCARWRGDGASEDALAVYGAGTAAFVALAAATTLENAWLTAAIAFEIPAIAWVESKVGSRVLRPVAAVLAGTVAVRLLVNWDILAYPLGGTPWFSWVLWGYGLPAACFALAARAFHRLDGFGSRLTALLEAGAAIFAVLFATLEIRLAIEGNLGTYNWSLFERSLQTLVWMAAAVVLLRWGEEPGRLLGRVGRSLAWAAFAHLVLGNLGFANPAATGVHLGRWPILDLLLPAFLLPAALGVPLVHAFARRGQRIGAAAFAILAVALAFVWVTLEISRLFQGPVLDFGRPVADAEVYAWSAAWIAFSASLFTAGARAAWIPAAGRRLLLRASLAVMVVTTFKVFLFDMSDLDGLWRVASFFVLGLSLIAVGWAWRRFVASEEGPAGNGQ